MWSRKGRSENAKWCPIPIWPASQLELQLQLPPPPTPNSIHKTPPPAPPLLLSCHHWCLPPRDRWAHHPVEWGTVLRLWPLRGQLLRLGAPGLYTESTARCNYQTGCGWHKYNYPQTLLTTTVSDIPPHARPLRGACLDSQKRTFNDRPLHATSVWGMPWYGWAVCLTYLQFKRDVAWHSSARQGRNPGGGNTFRGHTISSVANKGSAHQHCQCCHQARLTGISLCVTGMSLLASRCLWLGIPTYQPTSAKLHTSHSLLRCFLLVTHLGKDSIKQNMTLGNPFHCELRW